VASPRWGDVGGSGDDGERGSASASLSLRAWLGPACEVSGVRLGVAGEEGSESGAPMFTVGSLCSTEEAAGMVDSTTEIPRAVATPLTSIALAGEVSTLAADSDIAGLLSSACALVAMLVGCVTALVVSAVLVDDALAVSVGAAHAWLSCSIGAAAEFAVRVSATGASVIFAAAVMGARAGSDRVVAGADGVAASAEASALLGTTAFDEGSRDRGRRSPKRAGRATLEGTAVATAAAVRAGAAGESGAEPDWRADDATGF
jgi:hypothetical protein